MWYLSCNILSIQTTSFFTSLTCMTLRLWSLNFVWQDSLSTAYLGWVLCFGTLIVNRHFCVILRGGKREQGTRLSVSEEYIVAWSWSSCMCSESLLNSWHFPSIFSCLSPIWSIPGYQGRRLRPQGKSRCPILGGRDKAPGCVQLRGVSNGKCVEHCLRSEFKVELKEFYKVIPSPQLWGVTVELSSQKQLLLVTFECESITFPT